MVLDSGSDEPLKAAVHGAIGALVAVAAGYNLAAWLYRRDRHLALNAVVYTGLVAFEAVHVAHHLRSHYSESRNGSALSEV